MTTRNHRIRFMANNQAAAPGAVVSASSAKSGYPASNALDMARYKLWVTGGAFVVTATNKLLYVNDGADKTATLVEGTYTYSTLATHVAAQLNVVSSSWTCTYDFSGGTFRFTINRSSGTKVLRLSQQTTAAWATLGFTGTSDLTTGPFVGNEPRNHTSETWTVDLGVAKDIKAFIATVPVDEVFAPSAAATLKLRANNVPVWTAPPIDRTLTAEATGIAHFLDDLDDTTYRYWQLGLTDMLNPVGPEGFRFSHLYLGDYVTIGRRNIASGLAKELDDPSTIEESDAGARYANLRRKLWRYDDLTIQYLDAADRLALEQLYWELGTTTPFYVAFDPTAIASASAGELTKMVYFNGNPRFTHVKKDIYTMSLSLREAI